MNLDELRSAQSKERRKDSLQHLRDSFYDDVASYVEDLRAARDRRAEQVAKPFSDDDVRRMSDEVETAEEVAEALYERRVGKVVKLASFAAADMSVDADGMTTEERQLFDDLVDRISENKSRVLDVLSGEVSSDDLPHGEEEAAAVDTESKAPAAGEGSRTEAEPHAAESEPHAAEDETDMLTGAMSGAGEKADDDRTEAADEPTPEAPPAPEEETTTETDSSTTTTDGGPTAIPPESAPPGAAESDRSGEDKPTANASGDDGSTQPPESVSDQGANAGLTTPVDDRVTVRITRDVGAIYGVDEREYDLANEDVVTLPVENADPLVQRDAAERID